MGFTPDLTGMYVTDSVPHKIYYFNYDRKSGNLTNRRVFAEIPADQGVPDGMTVDAEGYVWSAIGYGGRVKPFAPDGSLDQEISLPAMQTASLTFGGAGLTEGRVRHDISDVDGGFSATARARSVCIPWRWAVPRSHEKNTWAPGISFTPWVV